MGGNAPDARARRTRTSAARCRSAAFSRWSRALSAASCAIDDARPSGSASAASLGAAALGSALPPKAAAGAALITDWCSACEADGGAKPPSVAPRCGGTTQNEWSMAEPVMGPLEVAAVPEHNGPEGAKRRARSSAPKRSSSCVDMS